MFKEIHQHAHQFSILAGLLTISLVLMMIFNYSRSILNIIIGGMLLSYLGWGIGHHLFKRDLTGYIVLEYLMVSAVAGVLLEAVLLTR